MTNKEKIICFMLGPPRSGNTWMQRLLQSHPKICGGEESHFFTLFAHPMSAADKMASVSFPGGPLLYTDRQSYTEIFRDIWNEIFSDLYTKNDNCLIHLEKTPIHALYLEEITRLFPDCKIIFMVRDSRAVTSSLMHASKTWGAYWAPNTYKEAALEWYRSIRAVLEWQARNPDHPFLQVRYEDALHDTPAELERILRFLFPDADNLQVTETLEIYETQNVSGKDPKGFSRKRGTDGWKADMSIYGKLVTWRYTRKLMKELGYDISIFT